MSLRKFIAGASAFAALAIATNFASAQTIQAITGHVVSIETTYMPNDAVFTLSTGVAGTRCAAGEQIHWLGGANTDNVKATYAGLLAAMAKGSKITVYVPNPAPSTGNCNGIYMYLYAVQ